MTRAAGRGRAVARYTLLRLLAFAVPFLVVWLLGGNVTVAAFAAAIVGLCISVIFLSGGRGAMSGAIVDRLDRRRADTRIVTDEDAEDASIDRTR